MVFKDTKVYQDIANHMKFPPYYILSIYFYKYIYVF